MELYTDGYIYKKGSEKKKSNLYNLKIKLLTSKYYNDKSDIQIDIYNFFKGAIKNLKLIERIESNSNIEYMIYKTTSKPAFLWQEKIINTYKFFCTMIGIIDGQLDKINRDINFELNFIDNKTSKLNYKSNPDLDNLLKEREKFLTYRNTILEEYQSYDIPHQPQIVTTAIENYPSHQFFKDCFEDIKNNSYQLNLQVEFINAYNKGYTTTSKINFDEIYDEYKRLFEELMNFKKQLNFNEKKVKTKKECN